MGYRIMGIDESNHGKFPEIFVGVLSFDSSDFIKHEDPFLSKRRRNKIPLENILEHRPFRYVKITDTFKEENNLHPKDITLLSSAALIKEGSLDEAVDEVIIDGQISSDGVEAINKMIYPFSPKIYAADKGDRVYPLVNIADSVAYHLYNLFSSPYDYNKHLYNSYQVFPDINNWREFLVYSE